MTKRAKGNIKTLASLGVFVHNSHKVLVILSLYLMVRAYPKGEPVEIP
jgi:hypothetical protein